MLTCIMLFSYWKTEWKSDAHNEKCVVIIFGVVRESVCVCGGGGMVPMSMGVLSYPQQLDSQLLYAT